ncbi:hypothetical protein MIR68_002488 [Amoeboaphelidium protococcarum]|nr:hypothetical protein MIR68_002488 [Amoeboaphelidium protococcarum]
MTSYQDKGVKPPTKYYGFDHLKFYVGNAKQAASYYCTRFGFEHVGYRGLETGDRDVVSHVVQKNKVFLVFSSALNPPSASFTVGAQNGATANGHPTEDLSEGDVILKTLTQHGDFVRDVAFTVDDARLCYKLAMDKGAKSVQAPQEEKDQDGVVVTASIATYGDSVHTFVERKNYKGDFLPKYKKLQVAFDPISALLPDTILHHIDHVVGNQPDQMMVPACDLYEKQLMFHRFWSVDDSQIHTQYSALRSIVMADYDEVVKMPINEPAVGLKKSQIQEYVEYHGGAGVQHIAVHVTDIIKAVEALRARGVEFLTVPTSYYDNLKQRLKATDMKNPVTEDLAILQKLHILVDFDENGYLCQIFTKPVEDRPTLFWEIIQRKNHEGFGAGNFQALFLSIEGEQEKRGNL